MNIKLKSFVIENFKGIKKFELGFEGKNVNAYGTNATGKTTLVDAFQWVLFDKDSTSASKFGIKPIDVKTEKEIHHLETMVEVVLSLDSDVVELKKIYKEKWTKQAGKAEKEFSGHTTDYFIDGVKKRKTDYVNKVNEIVDEEVFKMLTNVLYFNSIDWKARRNIVLSLAPELSVEEVIKHKSELKHIKDELLKRDVDDLIEIYKAERKKQNDLLKEIPIRIDELLKEDYTELDNFKVDDTKSRIKYLNEKLDDIKVKKSGSNIKSEILNLETEIRSLEVDKRELESFKTDKGERLEKITFEGKEIKSKIEDVKSAIEIKEKEIKRLEEDKKRLLEQKEDLYKNYDEEQARQFTADNCDYCGQALPEDKQEELRKQFNRKKVEKLEDIKEQGIKINEEVQDIILKQEEYQKVIDIQKPELKKLEAQREQKLLEYEKVSSEKETNPNADKIKNIEAKIIKLKETLETLQNKEIINPFENEETAINEELSELNRLSNLYEQKQNAEKRVEELEAQKKEASSNYSQANNKLVLCELFIVAKAELLENKINDNFTLVKFKMFEEQVNGGIAETCVATVNGVDFNDLNNAMKINAGLDIIKALQKVYDTKAPIFIDNAESVVRYLDMPDTQFIKLYVSGADEKLRFEIEEEKIARVA